MSRLAKIMCHIECIYQVIDTRKAIHFDKAFHGSIFDYVISPGEIRILN